MLTTIVLQIRLPRIILSFLVGMGLAAAGTVFQGVFRNPMADPYILGVSSGAALGVTLSVVAGLSALPGSVFSLPLSAFAGALGATMLVLAVAGGPGESSLIPLLLAGIAVSFLFSAGISLLMYLNRDKLETIVFWTFGSFSSAAWSSVALAAPLILAGSLLLLPFCRDLDLLTLGEESAAGLGLQVHKTRLFLLLTAALYSRLGGHGQRDYRICRSYCSPRGSADYRPPPPDSPAGCDAHRGPLLRCRRHPGADGADAGGNTGRDYYLSHRSTIFPLSAAPESWSSGMTNKLSAAGLSFSYGDQRVLEEISLAVSRGSFTLLYRAQWFG